VKRAKGLVLGQEILRFRTLSRQVRGKAAQNDNRSKRSVASFAVLRNIFERSSQAIDFTPPADVARHDRMVGLVERMLDLHKKLAAEQAPHVKTVHQRHAAGGGHGQADRRAGVRAATLGRPRSRIGLTDEEIAVVEGAGR